MMMKMKRTSFYLVTDRQNCLQEGQAAELARIDDGEVYCTRCLWKTLAQGTVQEDCILHRSIRRRRVLSGLHNNFEYLFDVLLHDEERDGAYSMVKRAFCEGYSGCIMGIYTYSCNDKDRKGTVKNQDCSFYICPNELLCSYLAKVS